MFCTKCGTENIQGSQFCKKCGHQLENEYEWVKEKNNPEQKKHPLSMNENAEPLHVTEFLLYIFLFMLPGAGIIIMLVCSFGGTHRTNLKNFARGYLMIVICIAIIGFVFFITGHNYNLFATRQPIYL